MSLLQSVGYQKHNIGGAEDMPQPERFYVMQFIDTHIHLQDFKADCAPRVWHNPEAKGLVLVSAGREDFAKIAALLRQYPGKASGAFGIHPWHYREKAPLDELETCLREFPQALVGEIGVDELKEPVSPGQHDLFAAQLEIATAYRRPVIVHAAKAFAALTEHETALKKVKFSHHGFVKNRELLKFINKCGGYIGLGALFLKQEKAAEMWAMMPQDRILFETDAPYRVDETKYNEAVQENLRRLAEIAGEEPEALAERRIKNAEDFLRTDNLQINK